MPYIGNTIRAADDYRLIDDISSGFNGSETSFALQVAGSAPVPFPKSPQQVLISVNGVIQEPDPTGSSGFNLVGTNIVFSSAPTNGHAFFGIIYATADYLNAGGNFPAGSLGAPSITFIGDENSGLYRKGGGSVGFVSDATEIANFDSNGITISSGNLIIPDSIIHNGDSDTKIRFPSANVISFETAGVEKISMGTGEVTFNDTGADVDFRIEGDTNANLFKVDAGNDRIGIATSSPDQLLHLAAASNGPFIRFENTDTTVSSDQTFGGLEFESRDTSAGSAGVIAKIDCISSAAFDGTSANGGELRFHTSGTNSISLQERIRIDAIGNVGIGTNNPSNKVEIVGGTGVNVLLNAATHDASTANQARLQLGFVHSGGQALGHIKLDEGGNNSFDGILKLGVPYNNQSGGSSTREVIEADFNGNICLPGSTTVFDTTARTNGLQLYYETDSGIATIGSYSSGGSTALTFLTNNGGGASFEGMRLNNSGQLLINKTTNRDKYFNGTYTGKLQVEGTDDSTRLTQLVHNSNSASQHIFVLGKSRGGVGSYTSVADGDFLGTISFQGADGDEMVDGARIEAQVNGTPGNDAMPTDMLFKTNTGGASPTERIRITENGTVQIAASGAIAGFSSSAVTSNIAPLKIYKSHGSTHAAIQLIWDHFNTTASIQQRIQFTIGDDASSDGFNNAGFIGIEKIDSWQSSAGRNSALVFGTTSAASESEKMRIDNAGRVIIGRTSTAASDTAFRFQVFAPSDGSMGVGSTNTSASGTATINLMPSNSVTGSQIKCSAEEDFSTSANRTARLGFFTRKDGTLTERLRLTSDGDFRFGNVAGSNSSQPHQNDGGTSSGVLMNAGTDNANYAVDAQSDSIVIIANKTQGNGVAIEIKRDGVVVGSISISGSTTSYNTTSDYRLKENIVNITDGITRIKQLIPKRFNWISDDTNTLQDGFLAHEAQTVVPEAVQGVKDELAGADYKGHSGISEGDPVYQEMDHSKLVPLLTAALQEEIAKREALETRIAALEAA